MSELRAHAEQYQSWGFKALPLNPADKSPFFDRLPWRKPCDCAGRVHGPEGHPTTKKANDRRYAGELFADPTELDFMFPDDESGMALGVGPLADGTGRMLVDFDLKGVIRTWPLERRLATFRNVLAITGAVLPDGAPMQETGSGGLQVFLAYPTPPSSFKYGDVIKWKVSPTKALDAEGNVIAGKTGEPLPQWAIDLKASWGYGAVAPTRHPTTGRAYRWLVEPRGVPPRAPMALLLAVRKQLPVRRNITISETHDVEEVNLRLAAVILASRWPESGGQYAALGLGGWLARGGLGLDAVEELVDMVRTDAAQPAKRVTAAREAYERQQDSGDAAGLPTLVRYAPALTRGDIAALRTLLQLKTAVAA